VSSLSWIKLDPTQWKPTPFNQDPLHSHHPSFYTDLDPNEWTEGCDGGWWIENDLIEVSTAVCDYFSMSYPLDLFNQALIQAIDPSMHITTLIVKGGIIHDALTDIDPAQAHVAILFNQDLLWEIKVPIPSASQYHSFQVEIPAFEMQDGESSLDFPFTLHLHNHGANQWRWLPLQIGIQAQETL
jgi:hypothetical protein